MPSLLITKSKTEAQKYFSCFQNYGYSVIYLPTIATVEILDKYEINSLLMNLAEFDYLIFTSGNAVRYFNYWIKDKKDQLHSAEIIAVGSATKRIADECGFTITDLPYEFSSDGLLKFFEKKNIERKKILIPSSKISRNELEVGLKSLGADVKSVPFYDTTMVDADEYKLEINMVKNSKPQVFAFTSPSSFENYIKLFDIKNVVSYFDKNIICAIGNTTAGAIEGYGLKASVVPNEFSLEGLAMEIKKFLQIL